MIRIHTEEFGVMREYEVKHSRRYVLVSMTRRPQHTDSPKDVETISMTIDRETFIAETEKLLEELKALTKKTEWTCEWCHPSKVPEDDPQSCKIVICPKHGLCWHYPAEAVSA